MWTARVSVVRDLSHANGAELRQRLDADEVMHGSHFGKCSQNKGQVAKSIARRGDDVRAHLAAVAARDAERLAADLHAIRGFSAS